MPSQILLTPLASAYLNSFAAHPRLGTIDVPILLRLQSGILPHAVPLEAAVESLGMAYLEQLQAVISGIDSILGDENCGSLPATEGRWGVVRSAKDPLTTFYQHGPGPRSLSVGLSPERHEHRLKVKISVTTNHSETTMEQAVTTDHSPDRLVCLAPHYSLYLHAFAVSGLRHILGLSETTPLGELIPAFLDHLGVDRERTSRRDNLKPKAVTDPGHIHEIGYTAYRGGDGHQTVLVEGALLVQNLEETSFEEWLNIGVSPNASADRNDRNKIKTKLLEIWNLHDSDLYPADPSEEETEAYRRLTRKIYQSS